LITNASKFSEPRDQIFVLLKVAVGEGGTYISIEVVDTGIGISEAEQEKLFKPFFRTSDTNSIKMNPGGNGIGLNISKNIAQCLKGDLTCKSKVGQGSTFTFTFEA